MALSLRPTCLGAVAAAIVKVVVVSAARLCSCQIPVGSWLATGSSLCVPVFACSMWLFSDLPLAELGADDSSVCVLSVLLSVHLLGESQNLRFCNTL